MKLLSPTMRSPRIGQPPLSDNVDKKVYALEGSIARRGKVSSCSMKRSCVMGFYRWTRWSRDTLAKHLQRTGDARDNGGKFVDQTFFLFFWKLLKSRLLRISYKDALNQAGESRIWPLRKLQTRRLINLGQSQVRWSLLHHRDRHNECVLEGLSMQRDIFRKCYTTSIN